MNLNKENLFNNKREMDSNATNQLLNSPMM